MRLQLLADWNLAAQFVGEVFNEDATALATANTKQLEECGIAYVFQGCKFMRRSRSAKRGSERSCSLQLGVFRFGLLQDGDVGVGLFPESEEVLVGSLCLGLISGESECST